MGKTAAQMNGERHVNFVEGDNWSGISKREYFAGLAMQGIMSYASVYQKGESVHDRYAKMSVEMADALLKELEIKQKL